MDVMDSLATCVHHQELVAALGDGVVVADTNGRIKVWNSAAERIFGFAKAEALGRSLDLIIPAC